MHETSNLAPWMSRRSRCASLNALGASSLAWGRAAYRRETRRAEQRGVRSRASDAERLEAHDGRSFSDSCPDEMGASEHGALGFTIPRAAALVRRGKAKNTEQIRFEYDKPEIARCSYPVLDDVVEVFDENPDIRTEFRHCAGRRSTAQSNKGSSECIGATVHDRVVSECVNGGRLTSRRHGFDDPVPPHRVPQTRSHRPPAAIPPHRRHEADCRP